MVYEHLAITKFMRYIIFVTHGRWKMEIEMKHCVLYTST